MAALSFAAGIVMLVWLAPLRQRRRLAYAGLLAALTATAAALFSDDVGMLDLLFLALTPVPLALLIRGRLWYLQALLPRPSR